MEFFVGLACVLTIITLVGHGLWVLFATIFRALAGSESSKPAEINSRLVPCGHCGRLTSRFEVRCEWCSLPRINPVAAELSDIDAVERQLARFRDKGVFSAEAVARYQGRLKEYRLRVLRGETIPVEAPVAAVEVPASASKAVVVPQDRPQPTPIAPLPETPTAEEAIAALSAHIEHPPALEEPVASPPVADAPLLELPQIAPAPVAPLPTLHTSPSTPVPPRRMADMLATFMEDRNIRWGELVGGLLIVSSSIALVISLWDKLQTIPYFQFFIFVGVTAALFGVGLYTEHRWKLAATSQGVLIISVLLVPLNFAAMAGTARHERDPFAIVTQLVSLAVFVALVGTSARVLVPRWRWWLVLSVVGNSGALLLVPEHPSAGWFLALGGLPVALHNVASGRAIGTFRSRQPLTAPDTYELFIFLGAATFALAVALGLLVYRSADRALAFEQLSAIVTLAALPLAAGGLVVMQGLPDDEEHAGLRTAGTTLAIVGMMLMLVGLGLAWPEPSRLILVGLLNVAALATLAFYYRLSAAHVGAIAAAAMVHFVAFHLLWGHLADVPRDLLSRHLLGLVTSAQTGTSLVGLFVLLGIATEVIARKAGREHAIWYAGGAAVVAIVSLLIVTLRGYADGHADALRATIVYGVYGIGSLAINVRWQRAIATYIGLALAVAASLWALWWWHDRELGPGWATVLAIESLAATVAASLIQRRADHAGTWLAAFGRPLTHAAAVLVPAAVVMTFLSSAWESSAAPTYTATALAASLLVLAWSCRLEPLVSLGSGFMLASFVHALVWAYPKLVGFPWPIALLAHATVMSIAGWLLKDRITGTDTTPTCDFAPSRALSESALATSFLALIATFALHSHQPQGAALILAWLSILWLATAIKSVSLPIFSAFQATLSLAVGVAITAWLINQPWVNQQWDELWHPKSLQAYGIGLGALSLVWVVVRIGWGQRLLNGAWLRLGSWAVDRVVYFAVVLGQLLLLSWGVHLGVVGQLLPTTIAVPSPAIISLHAEAYSSLGWLVTGLLAVGLLLALWHRWRDAEALAGIALAATVPLLVAGPFVAQWATAAAASWGLSLIFVLGSSVLWFRAPLAQALSKVGGHFAMSRLAPTLSQLWLLVLSAAPVLCIFAISVTLGLEGQRPRGPMAGSWFAELGLVVTNLVPLVMVTLGLVGYAIRDVSPGHMFAGGLVGNSAVMSGYALSVIMAKQPFQRAESLAMLQWGTLFAAIWAIIWLIGRAQVLSRAGRVESILSAQLMRIQLGMASLGNALLLLLAFFLLAVAAGHSHDIVTGAAAPLGWTALGLAVTAATLRRWQLRGTIAGRIRPEVVGLVGMAIIGLVACTVERALPNTYWGFRTLMLGWAMYALSVVAATWWAAVRLTPPTADGPPRALIRTAAIWVRLSGILAVLLGLKAAVFHDGELLWSASAIALASAAGAAMAVWHRREGWAFTAGLGGNLAASLVVWHGEFHSRPFLDESWILLGQANLIASATVAVLWLAARRRLYAERRLNLGAGPLLALQMVVVVIGNVGLLAGAVPALIDLIETSVPFAKLPPLVSHTGQAPGWIAWLLAATAAAIYIAQDSPRRLLHIFAPATLGLGVLVACTAAPHVEPWLPYHLLVTFWCVSGLLLLALGTIADRPSPAATDDINESNTLRVTDILSPRLVEEWVVAFEVIITGLVVRVAFLTSDRPCWQATFALAVVCQAGWLAIWLRKPVHVAISGLLLNLVGFFLWLAAGPSSGHLAHVGVLALSIGAGFWTLVEYVRPIQNQADTSDSVIRYQGFAMVAALGLFGFTVADGLISNFLGRPFPDTLALAWPAWVTMTVAIGVSLWDARTRGTLPGLYVAGLLGVGLALHVQHLDRWFDRWQLLQFAAPALAGYVLATAIVHWAARQFGGILALLKLSRLSTAASRKTVEEWFLALEVLLSIVALLLGGWAALALAEPLERAYGAAATGLLVLAGVFLAHGTRGLRRRHCQIDTLVLGVVALAALACVWIEPGQPATWMNRSSACLVAAMAMLAVGGPGLTLVLPHAGGWAKSGRRSLPALAAIAAIALLATLALEAKGFDLEAKSHPMSPVAIVAVALAVLGAAGGCIASALAPNTSRRQQTDATRKLAVYVAEAILLVLAVHLRITLPWLFANGLIERYWTLILIGIAYAGAAMSELFERWRRPVLSEPLARTAVFLPMLPVAGHWLYQAQSVDYLAVLFLVALFYGLLAITKRSAIFAALSVVSGNTGLWVLWHRLHIDFTQHPQVWLIPLGLAALVAQHLNRQRLNEYQNNAIRYFALAAIYISSTTDLFIARMDQRFDVLLVLVLMGLSVVGVFVGMLLRVRSFLFLGVTFLLVDVSTMIHHASWDLGHTWVFWLSGIVVGSAIIALFAVFEKRRDDLRRALEKFRQWN